MDRRRPFQKGRRSDFVKLALAVLFALFIILYLRAMFKQLDRLNASAANRAQQSGGKKSNARSNGDDSSGSPINRAEVAADEVEGDLGGLLFRHQQKQYQDASGSLAHHDDRETDQPVAETGFIQPLKVETNMPPRKKQQGGDEEVTGAGKMNLNESQGTPTTKSPRRKFFSAERSSNIHAEPLSSSQRSFHFSPAASLHENRILSMYEGVHENHDDDRFFRDEVTSSGMLLEPMLRRSPSGDSSGSLRSLSVANITDAWFNELSEVKSLFQKFQQLAKDMRSGTRPAQYVLVHPVGQLCNRLMAITSGFLLALLTKRSLIIDDGGFYAVSSDLFLEPGFAWIATSEQLGVVMSDATTLRIENPESGVWVETEHLLCDDLLQYYSRHRHIDLSINQYFVPYMTSNTRHRSDLLALFRSAENVFFFVSHFLFRPIPQLQTQLKAFVEDNFRGKFVVGLQVRSGQDFTSNFMTSADWQLYFACALGVVPTSIPDESVLFFIATDTDQGRKAASSELLSLRWSPSQLRFQPGEFLLSNNAQGLQQALLDLMILAVCDDRVTTAWSSYGYFAAGYSGLPAAMVVDQPASLEQGSLVAKPGAEQRYMGIPHKSDKRVQCVRLPTSQPCFHKFASWGASASSCYSADIRDREMLGGRYC